MKLNVREAAGWFAKPPAGRPGTLIYGADAMRVALRRQELVAKLIGPSGDEEMRLSRVPGADLRRDKAALDDALKAQGFFPGPRAVLVEDATNLHADTIVQALLGWREGDAHMVITAGALKPTSALRKAFEKHPSAVSIGIYDDPPSRDEIVALVKGAGLEPDRDALAELTGLAQRLAPGDFRQTLEKISLYKIGDATPLTPDEITACAPGSSDAALDDMLNIVADARTGDIGPMLRRLQSQGTLPVSLCIGATRHFRTLHGAASDPGGPGAGIGKLRPPVFGPRRDAILRQAQAWGVAKLEQALHLLTETDLALRSAAPAPQMAVMERALIRLSMMGRR